MEKVRKAKLQALRILEKRSIRQFNLREKFEEHFPSEVVITGDVFPGVVFESHGRFYEVKSRKSGLIVYFDLETGSIREKPLEEA